MNIEVLKDKMELGERAAAQAASVINDAIDSRGAANLIVATGASQFDALAALVSRKDIPWEQVTGFHLDEYIGISADHPASFCKYLRDRFVSKVPLKKFHFINGGAEHIAAECSRLSELIEAHPIDVALIGIGENGHLAFNDPPADFDTEVPYLVVTLDEACRRQQLGEGWFATFEEIPSQAISMSVRQILKSAAIVCSVPDDRKSSAVSQVVEGSISADVPASILQSHAATTLYLDPPAASRLVKEFPQMMEYYDSMSDRPQYFDLQVNGYAGVDFNSDDLGDSDFHRVCTRLHDEGVDGILATVITNTLDVMVSRIRRIARAVNTDEAVRRVVRGIHIEGPFINETKGYVGAHPVSSVQPADVDSMLRLIEAAEGLARIVTIAPERDSGLKVIRRLSQEKIVVSAGHCDPSLNLLRAAIDAGLSMVTHVGNGCPTTMQRHDNIVQRVLSLAEHLWCCFIADGVHIPFYALGNYLTIAGIDRSIIVTDAISAAGLGPGQFSIGEQLVDVDECGITSIAGDKTHLAGSAVTMQKSVENLKRVLMLDDVSVHKLSSYNPRKALSLL